ncbi:MAG: hypothetical protein V7638_3818 [Acidobacteriota bacterium]|jgi:hypothetical protein
MELSDLLNETSSCEVKYKNYQFNCNVFTEKLTPTYKAKLIALATSNEELIGENETDVPDEVKDDNARMLSDLIQSWVDEKGEPIVLKGERFDPTYENWLNLSYGMMASFIKQITEHLRDMANPPSEPASPNS